VIEDGKGENLFDATRDAICPDWRALPEIEYVFDEIIPDIPCWQYINQSRNSVTRPIKIGLK
jgi:hypothetical protein